MTATAVVLGDVDLVRAVGLARLPCALFGLPDEPGRWSRHVGDVLPWVDHWSSPQGMVELLLTYAAAQDEAPVLLPQTDGDLLVLSRHRDRLGGACRFALAGEELVEDLVDKDRFTSLAERLELPVPPTRRLSTVGGHGATDLDIAPPYVVKPLTRRTDRWAPKVAGAKASHVANARDLQAMWPNLAETGADVLIQTAIEGPESRIESHHAYVDSDGAVAAEFTGRKIRTRPARYGMSTAVELTDEPDVAELGREVLRRVGLSGVAKADFKRDTRGRLHLLEVNPRFTLWHHPAAVAGQNVPALVYADLTGQPRPPTGPVRPGVRWCDPLRDALAAREHGVPLRRWVRFLAGCEAKSGLAHDDPRPLLYGELWRRVRARIPGG